MSVALYSSKLFENTRDLALKGQIIYHFCRPHASADTTSTVRATSLAHFYQIEQTKLCCKNDYQKKNVIETKAREKSIVMWRLTLSVAVWNKLYIVRGRFVALIWSRGCHIQPVDHWQMNLESPNKQSRVKGQHRKANALTRFENRCEIAYIPRTSAPVHV